MNRSVDSWPQRLAASGQVQDEALTALRELLLARLRRAFLGRTGVDETFLDDVVQEALVKTLRRLDQFQGASQFTTWATAIAIRQAYTELRRRRWNDVSLERLLDDESHVAWQARDDDPAPEQVVQQQSLVAEMYRIINADLTARQRTALLAELKGMPLEEIGRRMDSTRNAIYKLTHDARKRLKQRLEAAGYSVSDLQTA